MTEIREAVAYVFYCVGLEGLNTSLKTEEALIYVYDGPIAGLSSQVTVKRHHTLIQADNTAVIEVDESLFWNNAIES